MAYAIYILLLFMAYVNNVLKVFLQKNF